MTIRVLVIEDEAPLLENILETLEVRGYHALGTQSGEEGVALAQAQRPDVVVCDIGLPGMDGFTVLAHLRADTRTANVTFLFLTARVERRDHRRGMVMGADDFVTKPFQVDELLEAIDTRVALRRRMTAEADQRVHALQTSIMYTLPHELRTPLTGVVTVAEMLHMEAEERHDARMMDMLGIVMRSGARLFRLIENYLVYMQTEVYGTDAARATILRAGPPIQDAGGAVASAALDHAQRAGRIDDMRVGACADVPLRMDSGNLSKLVTELVDNALKFSAPGTPVTVDSWAADGVLHIAVQDAGRGMSAEQVQQIGAFVQFERRLHEQQGLGLGLAIVTRLVALHQGHMHVESAPGMGTRITVSVPQQA